MPITISENALNQEERIAIINNLSGGQKKVYFTLKEYMKQYGYPPAVREICELTEYASTASIYEILKQLEKKKLIKIGTGCKARAIKVFGMDYVDADENVIPRE